MKLCIAAFLATATCSSSFTSPSPRAKRYVALSAISDPEITADGFIVKTKDEEITITGPVIDPVSSAVLTPPEPRAAATAPIVEPPIPATPKATSVDPRKQIPP